MTITFLTITFVVNGKPGRRDELVPTPAGVAVEVIGGKPKADAIFAQPS